MNIKSTINKLKMNTGNEINQTLFYNVIDQINQDDIHKDHRFSVLTTNNTDCEDNNSNSNSSSMSLNSHNLND